jgi:prevent-host-death family protein
MRHTHKRTCGAEEARQNLPALLEQAHQGKPTVITRHGRPYAALVAIEDAPVRRSLGLTRLRGTGKGLWNGPDSVGSQRDEWK